MKDFTLKTYRSLLIAFRRAGYEFITFEEYCSGAAAEMERVVVMRHDVDLRAGNALAVAEVEREMGVRSSYYFRCVRESNVPEVIRGIVAMGHEVGYHYEDMSICGGDGVKAVEHFEKWLGYFRGFYPVRTVCMHGAPTSSFDSKDIWQYANYKDFGVIGEPYFDVDFSDLFYITDTGRRWNGYKVSVRDKIPKYQDLWIKKGLTYKSSFDIVKAVEDGGFPKRLMMTTHPQRWFDGGIDWGKEWLIQNLKNVVKWGVIKVRG